MEIRGETKKWNKNRNNQIEALRGIAILIIVFYHLFDRYQQIYLVTSIRWMDFWGTLGVTIFFLISGYFVINPENEQYSNLNNSITFIINKIIRLWPCYILCISITFILTHLFELPGRTVLEMRNYLANLFLINRFLFIPYIDGAHWYLAALISMIMVIFIFKIFRVSHIPMTYIIWLLVELVIDRFENIREMYFLGGPFVGSFCIGIAIRFILVDFNENSTINNILSKQNMKWLIVIMISVLTTFLSRGIICTIELLVVSPIVILCIFKRLNLIENRILILIGEFSYSLYLIHQNVGFLIEWNLSNLFGYYSFVWPIVAILIVMFLGGIIHYIFEIRINNILHKIISL